MVISDAYSSLPSEYQNRVSQILAAPRSCSSRPPRCRYPPRAAQAVEAISERTKGVLKRTFGFWSKQTVEPGESPNQMSSLGFLSFCRMARVVSDELPHSRLLQIFDDSSSEASRLEYDGFLKSLQQVAESVTKGDLNKLLSEFVLPRTAGIRLDNGTKALFSKAVHQVLELHKPTLQLLYDQYRAVAPASRLGSSKLGNSQRASASLKGISLKALGAIGSDLTLWPELSAADVQSTFEASLPAPVLCFDGMCECLVRCTLAMLGPRTPVEWISSCLHQMLYSVKKQLNPPIKSTSPASSVAPSTSMPPSASSALSTTVLSPHSISHSAVADSEPPTSPAGALALAGTGIRRAQSAFGVLDRLSAVISGDRSPQANPRATELHSELLRARDRLVSTLVPRQGDSGTSNAKEHVVLPDDETDRQLQEYLEGKRQRLKMLETNRSNHSNSSWRNSINETEPGSTLVGEEPDLFDQLDSNNDGVIDRSEFMRGFKHVTAADLPAQTSTAEMRSPDYYRSVAGLPNLVHTKQAGENQTVEQSSSTMLKPHAEPRKSKSMPKQNKSSSSTDADVALRARANDIKARIAKAYQDRSDNFRDAGSLSSEQSSKRTAETKSSSTGFQQSMHKSHKRAGVGLIAEIQALDRARSRNSSKKDLAFL